MSLFIQCSKKLWCDTLPLVHTGYSGSCWNGLFTQLHPKTPQNTPRHAETGTSLQNCKDTRKQEDVFKIVFKSIRGLTPNLVLGDCQVREVYYSHFFDAGLVHPGAFTRASMSQLILIEAVFIKTKHTNTN